MTEFLRQKPWYARTKHDTDTDADADADADADVDVDVDVDADSYVEGAEPERNSASASSSDKEQEDAGFWIPQAAPDGRLFYFNTLTGASRAEHTPKMFKLPDWPPDWETKAIDSSQLPFADREDTEVHASNLEAVVRELARIDGDEVGDIDITLAKLEGQYEERLGAKTSVVRRASVEQRWQALLAETERKKAAGLHSGPSSSYLDDDSMISENLRQAEQAEQEHAEMPISTLADYPGSETRADSIGETPCLQPFTLNNTNPISACETPCALRPQIFGGRAHRKISDFQLAESGYRWFFFDWVQTHRSLIPGIGEDELRMCPLIWCRKTFDSKDLVARHVFDCPRLSNAWYWCPDHTRPERYIECEAKSDCRQVAKISLH